MHFELSPLIVWIALLIVNTFSEFQVNIFGNNGDITKCQFLHTNDNNNAKAIAIPWVFSAELKMFNPLPHNATF